MYMECKRGSEYAPRYISAASHRPTVYHGLSRRCRHPKPTLSRASLQLPEHHICSALFHTQAAVMGKGF